MEANIQAIAVSPTGFFYSRQTERPEHRRFERVCAAAPRLTDAAAAAAGTSAPQRGTGATRPGLFISAGVQSRG